MFDLNRGLEPLDNPPSFRFGTWDVEASEWWNLEMIGCFDGKDFYHFRTVPQFLDHILQVKYRSYRFFAHFGGRYDMNFIFDWVREHRKDVDVSFFCSGSMVVQMTLRRGGIHVKLCDSYRLFQAPLRELCYSFDVKHKKTEVDFETITYNRPLIEYNENDCRGLYEVIDAFFEETKCMSETFASHALKVWRKDFLDRTIWKPPEPVLVAAREAYHGGRVEVFKRTAPELNCYDVNSMYPYVMRSPMPTDYAGVKCSLLAPDDGKYGFCDASVIIPEDYITGLPVRLEKLFFPCGKVRRFWTSEELIAAEANGVKIQKIHTGYYFNTDTIFETYIDKLYALKRNAGEPTRTIAKLLMNSLYGKFGQNPTKRTYYVEALAPEGSIPIITLDGVPTGYAYFERETHNAYLLPHLAAAVTSKARLHLLEKLDDSVYYCDTDSVFTTGTMKTSKELGEWSEQGNGAATFYQPKLYKFKGEWKAKGLNKTESLDGYVNGDPNTVKRARSIKEALRDGTPACAHITIQKFLRESRPKRAWVGEDTRPWNMKEIEKK